MINGYRSDQGRLLADERLVPNVEAAVWVDLLNPTKDEEAIVEQGLGIDVPTREEMEEIEISSRLYYEGDAAFMTALLPAQTEGDEMLLAPVTFVLAGPRLVTIRYHEPRAFSTFPARASRMAMGCTDGESVLIALLEAQVDRVADILERASREIAGVSHSVFLNRGGRTGQSDNFQQILEQMGRQGDLTSNIRECLVSLERLIAFLNQAVIRRAGSKDARTRIRTLSRDTLSLSDHAGFLTQKITFLLDATLGLINIEQNAIIKIFSVAAVVFLPPTLIASIYGMNFRFMPELAWPLGYPFALLLMVVSAVLPYWFFKRRGWL